MIEDGDVILIESGRVVLQVRNILDVKVKAEVLVDGVIKPEKTLAIKGKDIPLPTLSDKDVEDVKFGVEKGLDYIGLSFVRTARDVKGLREILDSLGGEDVKILSKIETKRGVENLKWIVKESDAILVARGDLAIYYDLERIPEIQRDIVRVSRELGKPVMIGTQLLDSMCENPIPSRSEVVDVVAAIREGVDGLLLTGETAIGKYPVESVLWLNRIIREAEKGKIMEVEPKEEELYDRFAHGIVQLSESLGAKIVAYTRKGTTAYRLARYRPNSEVYAFTPMLKAARQLGILRGVKAYTIDETDPQSAFPKIIDFLREKQEITLGDIVILTAGMTAGATDIIRVEKIGVS
jgi:pyruvate kinase